MTTPENVAFDRFVAWYEEHARPVMRQLDPARAEEWDAELDRLVRDASKPPPETTVCFLGNAGVGKSTLINALVGGTETVLPAGGVGPLTAQALEVRYAEHPRLTAHYHPPTRLNRLDFGLRMAFAAELRDAESGGPPADDLDPSERGAVEDELTAVAGGVSRRDEYRNQVRLMITGRQDGDADLPYLLNGLRAALGSAAAFDRVRPDDRERVRQLRQVIDAARDGLSFVVGPEDGPERFRDELRDHAAGFLAPLIQDLRVECPSELLKGGVSLVDLPGVGVAGDVYRRVTTEWVREKARAIVLVVDRSGITEAAADLLRSSEFLKRLMYAAADPDDDPVALLIAVTRVDDVAGEMRRNDTSRSKSRLDYFHQLRAEFEALMRRQLGEQLTAVQLQGDTNLSATERLVIDRVVRDVQIHPLSAVEYRKLLLADDEDQPFIKDADETGLPGLRDALADLATRRHIAWRDAVLARQTVFTNRVLTTLRATVPAADAIAAELSEEAPRLRDTFLGFVAGKRREYDVRLGQFREFWKATLPQLIAAQVQLARQASGDRMRAYLNHLSVANANTLKAAVRRGGVFTGSRRIDLPHDLALCFDGAIAERWGVPILRDIRDRSRQFADDGVALVEEVVRWAADHGCPQVARRLADRVTALRADAGQMAQLGRDRTDELREQINSRLAAEVEGPIRSRCQDLCDRHGAKLTGQKGVIVAMFEDLGRQVAEVAGASAVLLLSAAVGETETAIREHPVFKRHPLDTVDQLAAELVSEPTPEARRRIEQGRAVEAALAVLERFTSGSGR